MVNSIQKEITVFTTNITYFEIDFNPGCKDNCEFLDYLESAS